MRTAIVLIAHGSRRAEANAELLQLAQQVRAARPDCIVGHAFLELAEPSIPSAVQACLAQGAERVRLFPYFLSSGVHVTRDIEEFRRTFAAAHPGVEFRVLPPLGAHAGVAALVLELLSDGRESAPAAANASAGRSRQS